MHTCAKLLAMAAIAGGLTTGCYRSVSEERVVTTPAPQTVTKSESSAVKTESSNSSTDMAPSPNSAYEHKSESSRTTTIQTNP